jgi:hypothetical protein
MAMNIWQITPFTRGLLELKKQQPLNQNRMEIGFHPENLDIALPFLIIGIAAFIIRKRLK